MSTINIGTSSNTAFKVESDTTGALLIKTGAGLTTALTLSSSQNATFAGTLTIGSAVGSGNLSVKLATNANLNFNGSSGLGQLFMVNDANNAYTEFRMIGKKFYWYLNDPGADSMILDASGNLGLGVTPSASSYKNFQINTTGVIGSAAGYIWLGNNWVYNSGDKYIANGYATLYGLNEGAHTWYIAPSGTAGNAITFTTAMTLDASLNYKHIATVSAGTFASFRGSDAVFFVNTYLSDGYGYNGANATAYVARVVSSGRSINAAGTVNASGADYAEYENNGGLTIAKGSIVGFKADGVLTLTFSEAVRFGVKSTNPSYVGGDTWGSVDDLGMRPDDPEELAAWEARLEAARQQVDRIAYSGKVPCNVYGATAGDYIIAVEAADGSIDGQPVADPDFAQYKRCVGRVNRILDDGRAEVAVIVH